MRIAHVQRRRDRVVAGERAAAQPAHAVVLGAVLQEGRDAEIGAQRRVVEFVYQPRIGAVRQPEGVVAVALGQRIDVGLRHRTDEAGEHRRRRGADQVRRRAEQCVLIEEDGMGTRLRIEILHPVVEVRILQAGAGAVHRTGRRGRNVDDRRFRREQPRAVGGLAFRILGHDLERVARFRHEDRHRAGRDDDAAAADRDQQIGRGLGRCFLGGAHRGIGRNPSRCRHRRRHSGCRGPPRCAGRCRCAG